MPSDPTVQVAAVGIFTTFITTVGVILVAVINNRKERTSAADTGVESTLRERLALRDEQIADLRADIVELNSRLDTATSQLAEAIRINTELQTELKELREKLA